MIGKIMIDAGMSRRIPCSGTRSNVPQSPSGRIGEKLSEDLEKMGYEVLFSENVPELAEREGGAGRPALSAAIAKRWGAGCVIRLCVRASELPDTAGAEGTVFRYDPSSVSLSDTVLQSMKQNAGICCGETRRADGILLLRRTHCPGMVLILRLPFRQKEGLSNQETAMYSAAIAKGIRDWASGGGRTPDRP